VTKIEQKLVQVQRSIVKISN